MLWLFFYCLFLLKLVKQNHLIFANKLQSVATNSTASITQIHSILADNIQSVSTLSSPVIQQTNDLLANNLESITLFVGKLPASFDAQIEDTLAILASITQDQLGVSIEELGVVGQVLEN